MTKKNKSKKMEGDDTETVQWHCWEGFAAIGVGGGRGDGMGGVTCASQRCLRSAASRGLCVPLAWTESCPVSVPHLPAPPPAPEWSPGQEKVNIDVNERL